jgi:hypothetical protein
LERLAWVAAYDVLPLVSLETKRRLVGEAAREGHLLIFQHSEAVGRLVPSERAVRFEPATFASASLGGHPPRDRSAD